jgi:hypothetical protein
VPAAALTEEDHAARVEAEEAKRKKDSHYLAAESIKRELAESASETPVRLSRSTTLTDPDRPSPSRFRRSLVRWRASRGGS